MKFRKGQLVLARPRAINYGHFYLAKFIELNRQSPNILYGVELLNARERLAGGIDPWWCDENNIIPIPEEATKDQIKAIVHLCTNNTKLDES